MTDVATITTALTAITNSIAIAKAIKNADSSLEKAELKFRIAELIESLAEVKLQTIDIKELINEKDDKISALEESLKLKPTLVRSGLAYYERAENGEPSGDPFCSHCWETEYLAIHLHQKAIGNPNPNICPNCKNEYAYPHSTPIVK